MGFTPLEGLVMATRSGTVDPGLLPWLQEHENLSAGQIATALEQRSGLLALAGTSDMRRVEAAAHRGEPDAQLALDIYAHRLLAGIAAMSAATGGMDALVFTAASVNTPPRSGAEPPNGSATSASPSTTTTTTTPMANRTSPPPGQLCAA
jgi:acetate kinase